MNDKPQGHRHGEAVIYDKNIIFSETSPLGPALASMQGRLYLAWKGDGNDFLNIMVSTDGGASFINKLIITDDTSPRAPSLGARDDGLYMAFRGEAGTGNARVNVCVAPIPVQGDVIGYMGRIALGWTTVATPAVAVGPGQGTEPDHVYLAWRDDDHRLNLVYFMNISDTEPPIFTPYYVSSETSPEPPALCVHEGEVYIAWKGDGNDFLNVARVGHNQYGWITGLVDKNIIFSETSPLAPAVTSCHGRLYIAWKGDGNDFINVMSSKDGGASFGHKHTSWETTPQAPALCTHEGKVYIAWKGDGNDFLNVAKFGVPPH